MTVCQALLEALRYSRKYIYLIFVEFGVCKSGDTKHMNK